MTAADDIDPPGLQDGRMEWVLLAVVVLVLIGVVAVLVGVARVGRWLIHIVGRIFGIGRHGWSVPRRQPRCLRCRGTGWLNQEPERTFNFTGDGFEDRHSPATVCPDCGGTGRVDTIGP